MKIQRHDFGFTQALCVDFHGFSMEFDYQNLEEMREEEEDEDEDGKRKTIFLSKLLSL